MFKFPTPLDKDNSQILIGLSGARKQKGGGGVGEEEEVLMLHID